MRIQPFNPLFILPLLGTCLLANPLQAQDPAPTPPPAKSEPASEPTVDDPIEPADEPADEPEENPEEESTAPPSLDDLLGIEESEDGDDTDAIAEAERKRALDQALSEEKPTDAFKSAVKDMKESANLLRDGMSTGLGTQRLQIRIVDRLQILIDSARRQQQQQQQQQSSSSSSSESQQNPGKRQDGEQSGEESQSQQRNQSPSDASAGVNPPAPESAILDGEMEETGMEWGNLPPRVRERITQGMRDRVSELYRSLTEAYYKRMAEEASK